jgi:AraC-like DNA-binding protein
MIREKMYKQVQIFKQQGYSKKEIAAVLGMDPKTVAKYYSMEERDFRSYRQQHMFRDKRMVAHEKDIMEVYERNEWKRLNMSSVYDYLELSIVLAFWSYFSNHR